MGVMMESDVGVPSSLLQPLFNRNSQHAFQKLIIDTVRPRFHVDSLSRRQFHEAGSRDSLQTGAEGCLATSDSHGYILRGRQVPTGGPKGCVVRCSPTPATPDMRSWEVRLPSPSHWQWQPSNTSYDHGMNSFTSFKPPPRPESRASGWRFCNTRTNILRCSCS